MATTIETPDANKSDRPEVWLRGPVPGIPPLLMPAAHVLLQVQEEIERVAPLLREEQLNSTANGIASPAYHLRHIAGSIDRLRTYARGEPLSDRQRARLVAERRPAEGGVEQLVRAVREEIEGALQQIRSTGEKELLEPKKVGRAGLPSTTLGLLFHLAEHAARHSGQLTTTVKLLNAAQKAG